MHEKRSSVDPVHVALPDQGAPPELHESLVLRRAYRASPEQVMACWSEADHRVKWLRLPSRTSMTITSQVHPASLRAHLTDGMRSAMLELHLAAAGDLTELRLVIVPILPFTRDRMISAGCDERWEELLYELADVLAQ